MGKGRAAGKKIVDFEWKNLPERTLIVFDEAHYCKNATTQRSTLLQSAYNYAKHPENRWRGINILLLSATIIEKKENLAPFMYVLGMSKSAKDKSALDAPGFSVREFGQKLLAERRMTRCSKRDARKGLKDVFSSDIKTKMFKVSEEDRKRAQAACEEIRAILMKESTGKHQLTVRLRKRQELEAIRVAIMFDETKRLVAEGWNVACFFNFKESFAAFLSMVRTNMPDVPVSYVTGGQSAMERLKEVDRFQGGVSKVMDVTSAAGGVGIGFHDIHGSYPKYALHSPPESASLLTQMLGRMDRLGAKSNSVQRIVLIADTMEELIAKGLNEKMRMIGDLNGEEASAADNIFLYDVIHKMETKPVDEVKIEPPKVKMMVDKATNTIAVEVPTYMTGAFEEGLPQEAIGSMSIRNNRYHFAMEHRAIVQEFLSKLIR